MKKVFIAIALCSLYLASYSQDGTNKRDEQDKAKVRKEVKTKARKISKKADDKTDAAVKKVYPKAHKVKE
jgi:hypothetical protein